MNAYSKSNLKILILSLLPLLLVLALIYYEPRPRVPIVHYSAPYVEGANVTVKAGSVVITVFINAQGIDLPFTPSGGWVKVVETGQVVNLTVVGSDELVGYVPLTPQYLDLTTVGLRGLVYGSSLGHEASIGFFVVSTIHVVTTLSLTAVNYTCNEGLSLVINYSSPVPAILNSILNLQLIDNTGREFVILPFVNYTGIDHYLPAGSGLFVIRIPQSVIEGRNLTCTLTPGHAYFVSFLANITYIYPGTNVTEVRGVSEVVGYG